MEKRQKGGRAWCGTIPMNGRCKRNLQMSFARKENNKKIQRRREIVKLRQRFRSGNDLYQSIRLSGHCRFNFKRHLRKRAMYLKKSKDGTSSSNNTQKIGNYKVS